MEYRLTIVFYSYAFLRSNGKGDTMSGLTGSKTEKDLWEAFAGEAQANRRYLAFAKQANKESYPQAAKLFRAVAEAETVHAHSHLRTLGEIKSTAENLKEAISGETHEFKSMYPAMIEDARHEGNKSAEQSFSFANEVEKVHAGLYQKALDNLDSLEEVDYYVCSVCGYTCEGAPPERCPVCGAKSSAFFEMQ
jgi:rubrerythrin